MQTETAYEASRAGVPSYLPALTHESAPTAVPATHVSPARPSVATSSGASNLCTDCIADIAIIASTRHPRPRLALRHLPGLFSELRVLSYSALTSHFSQLTPSSAVSPRHVLREPRSAPHAGRKNLVHPQSPPPPPPRPILRPVIPASAAGTQRHGQFQRNLPPRPRTPPERTCPSSPTTDSSSLPSHYSPLSPLPFPTHSFYLSPSSPTSPSTPAPSQSTNARGPTILTSR